jgi:hypothetical protein
MTDKNKFDDLDKLIYGDDEFKLNSHNSHASIVNSSSVELNSSSFEEDNIDDGEVISLNHQLAIENGKEEIIRDDLVNNMDKIEPWQQLVQDELKEFGSEPIGKGYDVISSKSDSANLDLDKDFGIEDNKVIKSDVNFKGNNTDLGEIQALSTSALSQTRNLVEQFKKIVGENNVSENISKNDNLSNYKKKDDELNIINLIRPIVKEWLDKNLPDIVKKVVLDEIKKIT